MTQGLALGTPTRDRASPRHRPSFMPRIIDYYFSTPSPWAYIGHAPFMAIAQRHGLSVNYKPVSLGSVFAQTGGLPVPQRHPARQRYRLVELQRWRDKRGLSFQLQPKHWPFDSKLADRFVIAIVAAHGDPEPFMRRVFAGIWEEERNLADPVVIAELAEAAGLDSTSLMEAAQGDMTQALYALNLENAIAADVFGSPAYVLEGEVFWGQDRLELLDDALASGREPYRAGS
jgi:2-hydroxychromene-2-carboxylate isomerase